MKTIRTTIEVDERRRATIQLPQDVPPGPHEITLQIDDPRPERLGPTFASHDVGPWPEGFTLRR